jgi:uncharacterized protein YceK|tara:strand:- start:427 stop:663 length:237 start_codon:yes stop_codon:yes gene_type:complete
MKLIILFLFVFSLNGCAFMVAKETAKVVNIVTETDKNPNKKEKILKNKEKKKKSQNQRAREFYCSKVKDPIKCEELQQ